MLHSLSDTRFVASLVGSETECVIDDTERQQPFALVCRAGNATLEDLLAKGTPSVLAEPPNRRRAIFEAVAMSLAHVHSCGFVMCNLAPAVCERLEDTYILNSFVAARQLGSRSLPAAVMLPMCAPEFATLILDESVTWRPSVAVDMWALGCILYHLLTGRPLVSDLAPEAWSQVLAGNQEGTVMSGNNKARKIASLLEETAPGAQTIAGRSMLRTLQVSCGRAPVFPLSN